MKILILGCCGFIASNFIKYILKHRPDWEIIGVDKLTYAGNLKNLGGIKDKITFYKKDICDFGDCDAVVEYKGSDLGVDYIVNLAAESHVDRSLHYSNEFLDSNIKGVNSTLNFFKESKTVKKILQISTDEVYSSVDTKEGVDESHGLFPSSVYSASKAAADMLCESYYKTYKTPINIIRMSNCYGPYQFPEKMIPLFIDKLLQGKKVPLYGDGLYVREWLYVEDACRAILTVLEKGKIGEIYNAGGGAYNRRPNLNIVESLIHHLDLPDPVASNYIKFIKDRPGHDRRYALDSNKIKSLGWRPEYTFEEGIKKTIQWYKDNQTWLENVKSGEYKDFYDKNYRRR